MRYRAFFSYARADDRIASWLHRQLDGYRTPKPLVGTGGELGPVPAKLHPIFRDRTDLESGGHVDAALQQALEDSETLIVMCTPTSAKSHWVNHEVETFLNLGREAAIFPVIAGGVPDSGDPETECFPPALRGKGLLAADLREIKLPTGQLIGDGREGGRLKLIAGLLGVKLDALVQRERRRQRGQLAIFTALTLVFASLAIAALIFARISVLNERRAFASQREAEIGLVRILRDRAWSMADANDVGLATRYALAGVALEPHLLSEFAPVLARLALQRGSPSRIVATGLSSDIRDFVFAAGGALAAVSADGAAARVTHGGALVEAQKVNVWALSKDGAHAVVPEGDKLQLVTWAGHRVLAQLDVGSLDHDEIALAPDTSAVAIVRSDGLRLWRWGSPQPVLDLPGSLYIVSFSEDGRRVLVSRNAGTNFLIDMRVQIFDTASGASLAAIDTAQQPGAIGSFSPDGAVVAIALGEPSLHLWRAGSGERLATLDRSGGDPTAMAFSKDGGLLAVGDTRGSIEVWDVKRLSRLRMLQAGATAVTHLEFSSAGELAASVGTEIKFWQRATLLPVRDLKRASTLVRYVAPLGDAGYLVASGLGWRGDAGAIEAISGDGRRLWRRVRPNPIVRAGESGDIFVASDARTEWEILSRAGQNLATGKSTFPIFGAAISADGGTIAIGGPRCAIAVLAASNQAERLAYAPDGAGEDKNSYDLALDMRGARLLESCAGSGVRLFDVATGNVRWVDSSLAPPFAITRDGRLTAVTTRQNAVAIVDADTGRVLRILRGHALNITAVAFDASGRRVVTTSRDRSVRVWDVQSGREMARRESEDEGYALTIDHKRGDVIVGAPTGTVVAWNVAPLLWDSPDLLSVSCASLAGAQRFSEQEIASDRLITDTWLRRLGPVAVCARSGGRS